MKILIDAFQADSLIAGYDNRFVNVFGETTARQVVDWRSKTLEHRTYSLHAAEALNELVGNVSDFERGEYENVGASAERTVGSLRESAPD